MTRRLTAPVAPPDARSNTHRWRAACAGNLPAEALSARDREELLAHLHGHGWADAQIAAFTRMTTYTTARIRQRLGLVPNTQRGD